ncbi:MAG: hypothetical protein ACOCXA_00615, partial [Planctomycetota bacterium]
MLQALRASLTTLTGASLLATMLSPFVTAAEPVLVADINIEGGGVLHPALFDGELVFAYNNGTNGEEPWISDGTVDGTRLLVDLVPGGDSSAPQDFVAVGDRLFFTADDGRNGRELWVYEAGQDRARMLKDIHPSGSSTPHTMVPWQGGLFFFADNGSDGHEPWFTDGSSAGTVAIADIRPGALGSSNGLPLATTGVLGDHIYFLANDGSNGLELWRSDGTQGGTELHADLVGGSGAPFYYSGFAATSSHLFFAVNLDGAARLMVTDGTTTTRAGTIAASGLTVVDDTLFFMGDDGPRNRELWTSDGRDISIVQNLVPDSDGEIVYHSGIGALTAIGDQLLFSADHPDHLFDRELWISDGTAAGTTFVHDTWPGGRGTPGDPRLFTPFDSQRFAFLANVDGSFGSAYLWLGNLDGSGARQVGSMNRAGGGVDGGELFSAGNGVLFAVVH